MGNPKDSSLFTGKGTPWGAMETGRPDAPQFEDLSSDPNKFQGPDTTPYRQAMMRRIAQTSGQNRVASQGALTAAGFGRSGDTINALSRIAGEQAGAEGDLEAKLDLQDWQGKMGLMDAYNRAVSERNRQKASKYQTDAEAYAGENKSRGSFYGGILDLAGKLGGGALASR